jgi:universal stress protein A
MLTIKTILHPTDFSEAAEQALEVAHALARDHGAKLVVMTVPAPPLPAIEAYVSDYELSQLVKEAEQQLRAVAATLADVPTETRVIAGEPGWCTVAAAKEFQADLIVMGTHGRKGLSRLLLGSVAEHVMRHAPCPVLTIKPGTSARIREETASAPAGSRT